MKRRIFTILTSIILLSLMLMPAALADTNTTNNLQKVMSCISTDNARNYMDLNEILRSYTNNKNLNITALSGNSRTNAANMLMNLIRSRYNTKDCSTNEPPAIPTTTTKPAVTPTATAIPKPTPTATPKPSATTIPTATPKPTATPVVDNNNDVTYASSLEKDMVAMVNKDRANNNLSPLKIDAGLTTNARSHSADMAKNNFFSHTSPTNGSFSERVKASGLNYASMGENLARYNSVVKAQAGLMSSDGHRANILGKTFTHIGIGIVWDEDMGAYCITQWFARK